ncbi:MULTISPECIES: DUF2690 domain-containing protein [Streptomyces]|uniref:DUF2690 domain-containing protein n=1 Tax=Streptomyces ramulosus TaxID=47762 RepID=A0ABW1FF68_9ACTN
MPFRLRRKASAVLLALATLGALGTSAAPAGATTPSTQSFQCYDGGCTGKDPQAMGCAADAVTIEQIYVWDNIWDLRYSPACNAHWGRLSQNGGGNSWTTNLDGTPPDAHPPYTFTAVAYSYSNGFERTWTAMGAGRDNVRMCTHVEYVYPTPWYCTKTY